MDLAWWQIAGLAALALYVAWGRRTEIKKLLGGLVPTAKPVDGTLARVEKWQELVVLCEGDCPEAVKLLDSLFPHLRSGHTHEVTK